MTLIPKVLIVEDQDAHRRSLRDALVSAGVRDEQIEESRSYDEAWSRFDEALREYRRAERFVAMTPTRKPRDGRVASASGNEAAVHRRALDHLPVVMVADVGLQDEVANGVALLGNAFRAAVEQTGAGLWTVAVTAHSLDRIGYESPHIPHMLLQKDIRGRDWPRNCARAIAPLLGASLQTDRKENRLAPTRATPPRDRIYLYERGDAVYANELVNDTQFEDCFDLGLIQPRLRALRTCRDPILMFRGRYVPLTEYSFGKLPRALLRARTVWDYRKNDAFAVEVMSYDLGGNLESQPASKGIPPKGLSNFITWLRGTSDIKTLVERYFGPIDDYLPAVSLPGEWGAPNQVLTLAAGRSRAHSLSSGWVPGPVLRCPADLRKAGQEDGFFTRLQFVMTEREIANYQEWYVAWTTHARDLKELAI